MPAADSSNPTRPMHHHHRRHTPSTTSPPVHFECRMPQSTRTHGEMPLHICLISLITANKPQRVGRVVSDLRVQMHDPPFSPSPPATACSLTPRAAPAAGAIPVRAHAKSMAIPTHLVAMPPAGDAHSRRRTFGPKTRVVRVEKGVWSLPKCNFSCFFFGVVFGRSSRGNSQAGWAFLVGKERARLATRLEIISTISQQRKRMGPG